MVYLRFPFSIVSNEEMKKEILAFNFFYKGSKFDEIIKRLLVFDPAKRLSSKELLEHLNGCVDY